jgi:hypothetical protein
VPLLAFAAVVGEAKEGEFLRLLAPLPCVFSGKAPECQTAGLLFGQAQPKLPQSLVEGRVESCCVLPVLEGGDKVVGVAVIVGLAVALWPHPAAEPEVQHVVQIDVGQQR